MYNACFLFISLYIIAGIKLRSNALLCENLLMHIANMYDEL